MHILKGGKDNGIEQQTENRPSQMMLLQKVAESAAAAAAAVAAIRHLNSMVTSNKNEN